MNVHAVLSVYCVFRPSMCRCLRVARIVSFGRWLQHAEALRVVDGLQQAVLQLLLVGVLGQQQHIEARVTGGQPIAVRPVAGDHHFQAAKAADRHAIGACKWEHTC